MDLQRTSLNPLPIDSRDAMREPLLWTPPARRPVGPDRSVPTLSQAAESDAADEANFALRRLIGDIDIRRLSPRQMAETSMDLYVAGVLPWEEYAMLAFQAELHPDYERTIGALTGQPAEPDRPRDFLHLWEERLRFEETYNAERPKLVARTRRIVNLFRRIDARTDLIA